MPRRDGAAPPRLGARGAQGWARRGGLCAALCGALALAGCGYGLADHVHALPPNVHSIAVPGLANRTRVPRLAQMISSGIVDELVRRTHYRVQPGLAGSDAVLRGVVTALDATPVTFDPNNGHATTVELTVHLRVWLVDQLTGKDLYRNDDLVFHDQYQISSESATLFEEDPAAYERLSRTIAADVVSAILEGF
ncbi:MAG TPA: LPS assembly lipoprotein LptE [Terriglobales bacterium]|nr:LPS assembly lipoprotein LptE [Terriglobales bacterium]